MPAVYQLNAVRFATVSRRRRENFIFGDTHDAPMPLDYYIWVIRGAGRTWLVDTGFDETAARERERELLRCPIAALSELGLSAGDVSDVILTHLHYDHAGNIGKLPNARFHIQEQELQFASGRHMCHDVLRHPYAVHDINQLIRSVYRKHVCFYDGDAELADGLHVIHIGGHTAGLQAVRVHTRRGWMVLASDAMHFYENASLHSPSARVQRGRHARGTPETHRARRQLRPRDSGARPACASQVSAGISRRDVCLYAA